MAGDALDEANETVVVTLSAPVNATLAAASGTGTIANDDDADLRVETTGPGTTTRTVNGHTVTVVVGDGVPAGVVVLLPVALDRDVALRFAPPVAGVPFESARFGLGETPDRRTVVDVAAQPVPSGGLELCLPMAAALRAEAGERGLRLLHYGASGWAAVARSRDDAARGLVCASGVTALSPFAVGYGDLKPTFAEAAVAPQRYREGTEIDPPRPAGGHRRRRAARLCARAGLARGARVHRPGRCEERRHPRRYPHRARASRRLDPDRHRRIRVERRIPGRAAGHRDGLWPGGVRRGADPLRRPWTVRGRRARLPAGGRASCTARRSS